MAGGNLFKNRIKGSASYIIESLFIILQEKPFKSISIGEITNKAGVHRTTFYRNFSDKEEVIKQFYKCFLREYLDKLLHNNPATAQEYLEVFADSCYAYKTELMLIYQNDLDHYFVQIATAGYVAKYCAQGMSVEEELAISYHYGGLYSILHWWCMQEMTITPAEMAKNFYNMDGIKLQGGKYKYCWRFEE